MGLLTRVISVAIDATLVSTVVAGVRRSSGFVPDTHQIPDGTARDVADKFLGIGETIFDIIQATAVNSSYFRKDSRK
ncbi:hypothetical protein DL96DRAFT_1612054 [Flagelloscypha sp. PMI_526]|nr:hypothetical protein DL96DRAFT_1612054 [Flagelloscypha sp. PMI_526]